MKNLILSLVLLVSFTSFCQDELETYFSDYEESVESTLICESGTRTSATNGYILRYSGGEFGSKEIEEVISECRSFLEYTSKDIWNPDRDDSDMYLDLDPSMSLINLIDLMEYKSIRKAWNIRVDGIKYSVFLLMDFDVLEFSVERKE